VYMSVRRTGRGRYEIFPELLFAHPKETADNEISEAFVQRLEREIVADPVTWLWSHRRWKHTRPKSLEHIAR
jgi:Kdo2-lipid IVA lauroyltransferase/acyltransferase